MTIEIKGKPLFQKRHRTSRGRMYDPSSEDKKNIRKHLLGVKNVFKDSKALGVQMVAYFEPVKSDGKKRSKFLIETNAPYTKKPDADNIAKIYLDAMNGFVYSDDNCISNLSVVKVYGEVGKVQITITDISGLINEDVE